LERGRVVELGPPGELMALRGRFRRKFDWRAQGFGEPPEGEGVTHDVLA